MIKYNLNGPLHILFQKKLLKVYNKQVHFHLLSKCLTLHILSFKKMDNTASQPSAATKIWLVTDHSKVVYSFCYLCFVFVMLSCLFIAALWSPAGKDVFLCFCHFPMCCPGMGVVLDCINS